MKRTLQLVFMLTTVSILVGAAPAIRAGTLMTLHPVGSSANFDFSGGELSTLDDGSTSTSGKQNAVIEYPSEASTFVSAFAAQPEASFTFGDIEATSQSTTFSGSLILQNFSAGQFSVYDEGNALLLSGNLTMSAITGSIGAGDAEGLFLAFGEITGGSMAEGLDRDSLRVKMKLPTVQGGFSVSPMPDMPPPPVHFGTLGAFTASALSIEILAEVVPEPTSVGLFALGALICLSVHRRN
jgi:hypothetical protein